MAVISGRNIAPCLYGFQWDQISDDLDNFAFLNFIASEAKPVWLSDPLVNNLPVSQTIYVKSGKVLQCYYEDYYNRIHTVPSTIVLGNLTSDQVRTVEIWNAYLTNKTLTTISQSGTTGFSTSGISVPSTFVRMESKIMTLTVSLNGAPDINATYGFNWAGANYGELDITGSRIITFTQPFEAPAQEQLQWNTTVVTANDGTEQRIRLRKHPRQGIKANYPIHVKDMPKIENSIYTWLSRRWAVPLWTEAQSVGNIAANATSITIDTTKTDFRANSLAYIYESNDKNITVEVISVAAGAITLRLPLTSGYSSAWVMPARIGMVTGVPTKKLFGHDMSINIGFSFTDNLSFGSGTAPTQFLGEDLYTDETLLGDVLEDPYSTRIDSVDFDTGSFTQFSPWKYTKKKRTLKYILQGMSEINIFRKWLHRRGGRQKPFWIPSFEDDFRVSQTTLISTSILIYDDNYLTFSSARKHICIFFTDGTFLTRTITSAAQQDALQTNLQLDTALANIAPSTIRRISYLSLRRLDTDKVDLNWLSNRVVTADIPVIEITP
jgi:hypothetical protein